MGKFKVGDKVKQIIPEGQDEFTYPEWSELVFTVIEADREDSLWSIRADSEDIEERGTLFSEDELELVEEESDSDLLPVGTRVRCVSESSLKGNEGVITRNDRNSPTYPYAVDWGHEVHEMYSDGWSNTGLEVIEEEAEAEAEAEAEPEIDERHKIIEALNRENLALRAAVSDAVWVFQYYAKQHSDKGTQDGTYKGMFNLMLAERMENALETNS